jgi:hypothetical protein
MNTSTPNAELLAQYLHEITELMLVMLTTGMWLEVVAQSSGMTVRHEQ